MSECWGAGGVLLTYAGKSGEAGQKFENVADMIFERSPSRLFIQDQI